MSKLDPVEVRDSWIETLDSEGRRKFVHPTITRPGGRRLAVFASAIDGDDGQLALRGKYLIPVPNITVEDGELVKVGKVWVTKHQAKQIFRMMGRDFKRIFKQDFGHMLFCFAAKAAALLLGKTNIALDPVRKLLTDNMFRDIADLVYSKNKDKIDGKIDNVSNSVKEILHKFAQSINPVLKELVGDDFDITPLIDTALQPVLEELRGIYG
jgi:hypothetical protein